VVVVAVREVAGRLLVLEPAAVMVGQEVLGLALHMAMEKAEIQLQAQAIILLAAVAVELIIFQQ
jgi:hypothetical protein